MTRPSRANDAWSTEPPSRRATIAGVAVLSVSLLCIGVITLSPTVESARLPFWCFLCGTRAAVDVLLNILMFVPVGVALGLLRVRARWVLVAIIGCTLAIEALQFTVVPGRFASFRDILANTSGGLAGWWVARNWRPLVSPSMANAPAHALAAAAIWIGIQAFTAWSMGIVAPPPPWWAQIKMEADEFPAVFSGSVLRSSIGTVPIQYSDQLDSSDVVRKQLLEGAAMKTMVTGAQTSAGPAPILSLATQDDLAEIAALVQTRGDVFFRVRTRAAVVGLRNPALRLADVFPPESAHDTITLVATYADGRYRIASDGGGIHRDRTLAASPSWGWALLMPIPNYSFGPEVRLLTAAWLFAVFALVGMWGGQGLWSSGRDQVRSRARVAAPIIVASIVGLAVVPVAFGLPVSHWSEWLAAAAGGACGWLLGHHVRRRSTTQSPASDSFA